MSKDFRQAFQIVTENLVVRTSILDTRTTLDLSGVPTLPGVPDGAGDLSGVEWVPEGEEVFRVEEHLHGVLEARDVQPGEDLACVCHGLVVPIRYGEVLRVVDVPEPPPAGRKGARRGKITNASVWPMFSRPIEHTGLITVENEARPGRPAAQFTVPAGYFTPARDFHPGEQLHGVELALAALP